ncbi:MAG: hypothetical protein QM779_10415 [Propionicimonas sp.]
MADLDYRDAVQAAATLAVGPSHVQRFYALHVGDSTPGTSTSSWPR